MATIHITGDRMMSPVYPPLVAIEMMRALAEGAVIRTGDTGRGIDAIVLDFAQRAGVEVHQVNDDAAEVDADTRVVFIHADAHASSRFASFSSLPDTALRLVTPADLLV